MTVKFLEVRKRKGTRTENGLGEVGFEIWLDTKNFPLCFSEARLNLKIILRISTGLLELLYFQFYTNR